MSDFLNLITRTLISVSVKYFNKVDPFPYVFGDSATIKRIFSFMCNLFLQRIGN